MTIELHLGELSARFAPAEAVDRRVGTATHIVVLCEAEATTERPVYIGRNEVTLSLLDSDGKLFAVESALSINEQRELVLQPGRCSLRLRFDTDVKWQDIQQRLGAIRLSVGAKHKQVPGSDALLSFPPPT